MTCRFTALSALTLFRCPLCAERFAVSDAGLRCSRGHAFDRARSGYVNLFPAHHRGSRAPGDDAAMVAARRRFLERGHYAPLAAALELRLADLAERDGGSGTQTGTAFRTLLDVGCGEGWFTARFARCGAEVYGIDVSKPAIQAAARAHGLLHLAVASSARPPVAAGAFDAVTVLMAPAGAALARLLRPGGQLLRVSPAEAHLHGLRGALYGTPRAHRRATLDLSGLLHREAERLTFTLETDRGDREALIAMTPLRFRASPAQQAAALAPEALSVTADFWIDRFVPA